jgi:hypothetical protein
MAGWQLSGPRAPGQLAKSNSRCISPGTSSLCVPTKGQYGFTKRRQILKSGSGLTRTGEGCVRDSSWSKTKRGRKGQKFSFFLYWSCLAGPGQKVLTGLRLPHTHGSARFPSLVSDSISPSCSVVFWSECLVLGVRSRVTKDGERHQESP